MKLTSAQLDRAAGVLLGMACGDALGAGYEFGPPLGTDAPVTMKGGGGFDWAPGEWTDDTSMAVPIVNAIAAGHDLRDETVLDGIVASWVEWARTAPDVGIQLRAVLSGTEPTASAVRVVARAHHDRHGRSGGNGSLMRTAPVALAYLDDPIALAAVARTISTLTHYETDAGDACVLWCLAIRHAVLEGTLDVRVGLDALPADRRALWEGRLLVAEAGIPSDFSRNGWVVEAMQAAWSAIIQPRSMPGGTSGAGTVSATPAGHLQDALEIAVRGGRDTDTVAAIAGGLLGARYGASAVPAAWRRIVHGWPEGLRADELVRRGVLAARADGGRSRRNPPVLDRRARKDRLATSWPTADHLAYASSGHISSLVRHPHDDGVWLGAVGILDDLPAEIDAVVSLCRVGRSQVPERIRAENRVAVWLVDEVDPRANPNLTFVLEDTVDAIAALRAEGRTVFVHCVQAISRTPTVGALYAARHRGVPIEQALREVTAALPHAGPNAAFVRELVPRPLPAPRPGALAAQPGVRLSG